MSKFIKNNSVVEGFKNAINGLIWAFSSQINFRIHIISTVLVLILGFLFKISYLEWLIIISVIATTIVLELLNTSIEQTTDAITTEFNPIIKKAKDVSAAAVLIFAIYALIIGLLIFGTKL